MLRQVATYVRAETGLREVDFYERLVEAASPEPDRWPDPRCHPRGAPRDDGAPGELEAVPRRGARLWSRSCTSPDDDALDTVLAVQHALLPDRARTFPCTVALPRDYAAWHQAMMTAKQAGHLEDWMGEIPRLRDLGPGSLTVEDHRAVCQTLLGTSVGRQPVGRLGPELAGLAPGGAPGLRRRRALSPGSSG